MRGDEDLSEDQLGLIYEHLAELGRLSDTVGRAAGLGARILDFWTADRVEAKGHFAGVATITHAAFINLITLEGAVQGGYSAEALSLSERSMEALEDLALSGNPRAQADVMELVRLENDRAIEFYCSLILGCRRWALDSLWVLDSLKEVARETPQVLETLLRILSSQIPRHRFSLRALCELADEGNALAKSCVRTLLSSDQIYFEDCVFNEARRGSPTAIALLVSAGSEDEDHYNPLFARARWAKRSILPRIEIIKSWKESLAERGEGIEGLTLSEREDRIFTEVMRQNTVSMVTDEEEVPEDVEDAREDLIREVRTGSDWAIKFYCFHVIKDSRWTHESFKELASEHPKIFTVLCKEVLRNPPSNNFSLKVLLELTNEGDVFANNCLATLFFSHPNIFMEQVISEAENGDETSIALLIAFFTENRDPILERRLVATTWAGIIFSRVRQIQRWIDVIPTSSRVEEIRWNDRPLILREKIIFQQVMRQNALVDVLTNARAVSSGSGGGGPFAIARTAPSSMPVMSKCFPLTRTWLVGVKDDVEQFSAHAEYLPIALSEIGRVHGIECVMAGRVSIDGVRCLSAPSPAGVWVQDNCSLVSNRGELAFRSTAVCSRIYREAIYDGRGRRRVERISSRLGATQTWGEQLKIMEFAHALDLPFSISPCFTEGGNSLVGRDEDGNPYVIIGRDTIAWVTAQIKEDMRDLGYVKTAEGWVLIRAVSPDDEVALSFEEDIRPLLAQNYGVTPGQVYSCEQPAEYHLDVAMKIIGPKVVMINDSVEAAENMLESLRAQEVDLSAPETILKIRVLKAQAERKKRIEDRAAEELVDQGFTVHRLGGYL